MAIIWAVQKLMTQSVLDLGLPEVDGLTVLDRWRKDGRTMPVLVLTARDSWSDKVAGTRCRRRRLSRQAVPDRRADRPAARADPPRCRPGDIRTDRWRRPPRFALGAGDARRRAGQADRTGIQAALLPHAPQGQGGQPHRADRAYLRPGFRSRFQYDRSSSSPASARNSGPT